MIKTTTYLAQTELKRDLLAVLSAIDNGMSATFSQQTLDGQTLRLLARLCALVTLPGGNVAKRTVREARLRRSRRREASWTCST